MLWLTEDAKLACAHDDGVVDIEATQKLVRIDGRRVLVHPNPEKRPIKHCPWVAPGQFACLLTLSVREGYSPTIRIDGKKVCLDTVAGLTNGTPQGTFDYTVRRAGQVLVSQR
jgi:hypothetical protein